MHFTTFWWNPGVPYSCLPSCQPQALAHQLVSLSHSHILHVFWRKQRHSLSSCPWCLRTLSLASLAYDSHLDVCISVTFCFSLVPQSGLPLNQASPESFSWTIFSPIVEALHVRPWFRGRNELLRLNPLVFSKLFDKGEIKVSWNNAYFYSWQIIHTDIFFFILCQTILFHFIIFIWKILVRVHKISLVTCSWETATWHTLKNAGVADKYTDLV